MGVKGQGLRSDGLHKLFMNGSQADHNGATESKRTGGNVSINNTRGLNNQFGSQMPAEKGTPGTKPATYRVNKSKRI